MDSERTERFRHLTEASLAMARLLSVGEVLEVVTQQAREVVGAQEAVTRLTARTSRHQPTTAVSRPDRYAHDRAERPVRRDESLVARLVGRGEPDIGVIELVGKPDGGFTDDDEAVLALLAQMASVAIENARLYEEVRDSRERFRALIDASPPAIYELDLDGRVRLWSRAAERLFGWRPEEVIGRRLPSIPAGYADEFEWLTQRILAGESVTNFETVRQRDDGTQVEVAISAAPVRSDGEIVSTMRVVTDISQRRRLEQQLRQAQKMEAIGRLAGGIAHDFSNLLTAVRGNAELLAAKGVLEGGAREDLEEIVSVARRGQGMIQQLLAVGRQQLLQPACLDLKEVVASLSGLVKRLIGEDIVLRIRCADGCTVLADRSQLEQVVLNLACNARDAMQGGGTLTLSVGEATGDAEDAQPLEEDAGRYAVLTVSDNGVGIAPELLEHVFEPFFTTKSREHGTGLGLSTVYGIVTQSGGSLQVESEPGRGSRFRVYLPLHQGPVDPVPHESTASGEREGGSATSR